VRIARADPDSAGVLGLSTALVLSKHEHLSITVVAKHMPGDYDVEYASPWAGANYMPVGKPGTKLRAFEKATWPELDRICRDVPEAGVHYQECKLYGRKKDKGTAVGLWFQELMKEDAWFKDLVPNVGCFSVSLFVDFHSDMIYYYVLSSVLVYPQFWWELGEIDVPQHY
jgi:D-amino-acid oxidase